MACCAGSPSPLAPYRLRDADACPSRRLALPLSERPSFLPALAILPILHPLPLWCHSESLIWAIMGQGKARYPHPWAKAKPDTLIPSTAAQNTTQRFCLHLLVLSASTAHKPLRT